MKKLRGSEFDPLTNQQMIGLHTPSSMKKECVHVFRKKKTDCMNSTAKDNCAIDRFLVSFLCFFEGGIVELLGQIANW